MDEEKLSQLNLGRTAAITLNWLEPIIKKLEKDTLDRLKSVYLGGKYTESMLAAGVAELTAIDNLRNKLIAMARNAESISKEVL